MTLDKIFSIIKGKKERDRNIVCINDTIIKDSIEIYYLYWSVYLYNIKKLNKENDLKKNFYERSE